MAKQTIDIGSTANDGTGDTVRAAFAKCNDNFDEVYADLSMAHIVDHTFSGQQEFAAAGSLGGYSHLRVEAIGITRSSSAAIFAQVGVDPAWLGDYDDFQNGIAASVFYPRDSTSSVDTLYFNMDIFHMGDASRFTTFDVRGRDGSTPFYNSAQAGVAEADDSFRLRCSGGSFLSGGILRIWGRK